MRSALVFLMAAACVSETVQPVDAGVDGDVSVPNDVITPPSDAGPCRTDLPFGTPTLLSGVNTPDFEARTTLPSNELMIMFTRKANDAGAASDIYSATRTAVGSAFSGVVVVPSINSPAVDETPTLDPAGLLLVFTSTRKGSFDLFVSSRANTLAPWGAPVELGGGNTANVETNPFLRSDGAELLFMSDRAGNFNLYLGAFGSGAVTGVKPIAELNTPNAESQPVLSWDGKTIYFSSTRTDAGSLGSWDIWSATRSSLTDPFVSIKNVSELNSPAVDAPGWVSPDGCRFYMDSDRNGQRDIYVAQRPDK